MQIILKQISSLEKVRSTDSLNQRPIRHKIAMPSERFSYQICMQSTDKLFMTASVEFELSNCIKLYCVRESVMDVPLRINVTDEDYIALEPGRMPDILVPLEETNYQFTIGKYNTSIWVKIDIPIDQAPGEYNIRLKLTANNVGNVPVGVFYETMHLKIINTPMPKQKLLYTRWFYADCIASVHDVEIYSEKHWKLIDKYIAAAADVGINMILIPTHTPPLDTEIGTYRPCVQLVDIEKVRDTYTFNFDRFKRFVDICKKNGIQYFELAHLFSQWGAKCAPNIKVTENGITDYMFGWHVAANSPEYISFLRQYIAAIATELNKEGIAENTYFHISDEPMLDNMTTYKRASEIIHPLIGTSKTLDAFSNYEFYEKGLVECPVTYVSHIHEFLEHNIENQWVYYCCGPEQIFTNSLLSMPSYRIRILGFLMYKYNIKGFLHWGLNFYNAENSLYTINPYMTTSADRAFPSGDPFILYPAKDGAYGSIRGEITYEAIQDMNICFALEEKIGREATIKMIDDEAGYSLRFDHYPRCKEYLENLRNKMICTIQMYE